MDKWILASEKLPEEDGRYLVFGEHEVYGKTVYQKRDITIGEYLDGKWKCQGFFWNLVIAWMPFPEVPQEV